jgi:hypothetical protein
MPGGPALILSRSGGLPCDQSRRRIGAAYAAPENYGLDVFAFCGATTAFSQKSPSKYRYSALAMGKIMSGLWHAYGLSRHD